MFRWEWLIIELLVVVLLLAELVSVRRAIRRSKLPPPERNPDGA